MRNRHETTFFSRNAGVPTRTQSAKCDKHIAGGGSCFFDLFLHLFYNLIRNHGERTPQDIYISYVIPAPLQFSGLIELESKDFFLFLQGQGDLDVEFSIRVQLDIGRFWYVRMFDLDGLQQCKLRLGNVKLAPVESGNICAIYLGG